MEPQIILCLLGLTSSICIFLAWFFTHRARHKERLLMIEKGMNPDTHAHNGSALFKLGIVIIGLSVGLAIISVLAQNKMLGNIGAVPISILGLSGGIALLIANRLSKPKN